MQKVGVSYRIAGYLPEHVAKAFSEERKKTWFSESQFLAVILETVLCPEAAEQGSH